jgi:hypothetical protein
MGHLLYGSPPTQIELEDRTLAHLQIAITGKLRRSEAFTLTLPADAAAGSGRRTLWLQAAIPLQFCYDDPRQPSVNPAWLDLLAKSGSSGQGMQLVDEPGLSRGPQTRAA